MEIYIEMARADQSNFLLRALPSGETTISCRACKVCSIRFEETEVKYHILSPEHRERRKQFCGNDNDNNNDSEYKVATYQIEQHGSILLNRNDSLSESEEDETIFRGIQVGSTKGPSGPAIGELAVKILAKSAYTEKDVSREIDALKAKSAKLNIVNLVAFHEDDNNWYIAYTACYTTLKKLVERKDLTILHSQMGICYEDILLDAANGLLQLHKNAFKFAKTPVEYIHRNIRPKNVLIYEGPDRYIAKISNLLMSKQIQAGEMQQSVSRIFFGDRDGYTAPELYSYFFEPIKQITKAVDIFSMGCTFYFVLSGGNHLFKSNQPDMQSNIGNPRFVPNFRTFTNCDPFRSSLAEQLIKAMTSFDPHKRPSIEAVTNHPFFWKENTIMKFLCFVSDKLDIVYKTDKTNPILIPFEDKHKHPFYDGDWRDKVDDAIKIKYRKYGDNPRFLHRAIRNLESHCKEEEPLRAILNWPNSASYWLSRFPNIVYAAYNAMQPLFNTVELKEFYPQDYNFSMKRAPRLTH